MEKNLRRISCYSTKVKDIYENNESVRQIFYSLLDLFIKIKKLL